MVVIASEAKQSFYRLFLRLPRPFSKASQ